MNVSKKVQSYLPLSEFRENANAYTKCSVGSLTHQELGLKLQRHDKLQDTGGVLEAEKCIVAVVRHSLRLIKETKARFEFSTVQSIVQVVE